MCHLALAQHYDQLGPVCWGGAITKPVALVHRMIRGKSFKITAELLPSKALMGLTRKGTKNVGECGFFTHLKNSNF